jgi:16S rRNA G966 N2-methylase RsmD
MLTRITAPTACPASPIAQHPPSSGDRSVSQLHGLELAWRPELSGGGRGFGQDFIPLVGHLFGRVGRLLEFCAGPGYIGFSLLAHQLCDHLVLSDVNPRAIEVLRDTVRMNELEKQVTIYESDGLAGIPSHERWDLVVANPPHFATQFGKHPNLITDDPEWRLHRDFYGQVGDFLAPGGSVLMQENSEGSSPEDFLPMIADSGLSHVRTIWFTGGQARPHFYYLWVKKTLPGLAFDDVPVLVTLPLRDGGAASPLAVPAGRSCSVRLVNETDRAVRPQVLGGDGGTLLPRSLGRVEAGEELQLPLMALPEGEYEVRDSAEDVTLGRLVAS